MSDKAFETTQIETTNGYHGSPKAAGKPTFMQRYKAHMRKWWWAHLLLFIAGTLIVTLCIVYVAFPRIAQSSVDDATVEITNLVVINPTPNSIHLVQDAISRSTSPYHPWLDPFNVSIGLLGAPAYGIVGLPGLTSGDHVPVHIEQDVQLIDPDAFADYNVALITSQSIQQTITGSTWLHEGSLPATDVSYNKQPTIVGFNNLTGLNITQFAISLAPQSDGTNINGTLLIPNPTIITVAMGNVTFNTFVNDTLIGNATIQDFVLKPGNNSYSMRGVTDQVTVLSMLQNNYPSGILPVRIVGNSSIYNGQHLTYYEKALQANTQHLNLNVGAALAAAGINITGGGL